MDQEIWVSSVSRSLPFGLRSMAQAYLPRGCSVMLWARADPGFGARWEEAGLGSSRGE